MASEEIHATRETLPEDIILELPSYVPLQNELTRDFDLASSFQNPVADSIKSTIDEIIDTVNRYINTLSEMSDSELAISLVTQSLENIESLIECELKLHTYNTSISNGKKKIKASMIKHPELNLKTLEYFHNIESDENLYGHAINEYNENVAFDQFSQSLKSYVSSNQNYQHIKKCAFIIQNPEAPLPDEMVDEDLAVSGGNISLRDPLSMDFFEDPVFSTYCNHTYERKTVERYLESASSVQCPIPGCDKQLLKRNLKKDETMLLRIKAFQFHERNKKTTTKVERVV